MTPVGDKAQWQPRQGPFRHYCKLHGKVGPTHRVNHCCSKPGCNETDRCGGLQWCRQPVVPRAFAPHLAPRPRARPEPRPPTNPACRCWEPAAQLMQGALVELCRGRAEFRRSCGLPAGCPSRLLCGRLLWPVKRNRRTCWQMRRQWLPIRDKA